jgi:hypothetical protein
VLHFQRLDLHVEEPLPTSARKRPLEALDLLVDLAIGPLHVLAPFQPGPVAQHVGRQNELGAGPANPAPDRREKAHDVHAPHDRAEGHPVDAQLVLLVEQAGVVQLQPLPRLAGVDQQRAAILRESPMPSVLDRL